MYAYNETDLIEGDRIQRCIDGDPLVQEEFNEITSVISILDEAQPLISADTLKKLHSLY